MSFWLISVGPFAMKLCHSQKENLPNKKLEKRKTDKNGDARFCKSLFVSHSSTVNP